MYVGFGIPNVGQILNGFTGTIKHKSLISEECTKSYTMCYFCFHTKIERWLMLFCTQSRSTIFLKEILIAHQILFEIFYDSMATPGPKHNEV